MKARSRYAAAPLLTPPPAHSEPGHTRQVHRGRSTPPGLTFPKSSETALRLALRIVAGAVFITLGQMKFFDSILLGTDAVTLPTGPEGFAQYLGAIGVPFPLLSAYMVCIVEMICGVGLVLSAFLPAPAILTRLTALPLFMDMTVAILTVGVPNLMGDPVRLEGIAVTHQVWRFPLEFGLWLAALVLLVRPLPKREPTPTYAPSGS